MSWGAFLQYTKVEKYRLVTENTESQYWLTVMRIYLDMINKIYIHKYLFRLADRPVTLKIHTVFMYHMAYFSWPFRAFHKSKLWAFSCLDICLNAGALVFARNKKCKMTFFTDAMTLDSGLHRSNLYTGLISFKQVPVDHGQATEAFFWSGHWVYTQADRDIISETFMWFLQTWMWVKLKWLLSGQSGICHIKSNYLEI
jgi:hypothetical protein